MGGSSHSIIFQSRYQVGFIVLTYIALHSAWHTPADTLKHTNMYLPRDKLVGWFGWPQFRVDHEQHVREPGAKIDSVDVVMS